MDQLLQTAGSAAGLPLVGVQRPVLGSGRQARRLYDKLLIAFHHACDAVDLVVADQVLALLEEMALRGRADDGQRRRTVESLVAAHERLWHLRHPQFD